MENACNPVDVNAFLSGNHYPDLSTLVPGVDATLAGLFDNALDDIDNVVALSRAGLAALDRRSGALQMGNEECAAERSLEAEGFLDQIKGKAVQWRANMRSIVARADANIPATLNQMMTQRAVRDILDLTVAGQLSTIEGPAFSAWNVTSEEKDDIETRTASITDADINEFFQGAHRMTVRDGLLRATDLIVEGVNAATIPELVSGTPTPAPTPTPTPTMIRRRHKPHSPHLPHRPHAPQAPHAPHRE